MQIQKCAFIIILRVHVTKNLKCLKNNETISRLLMQSVKNTIQKINYTVVFNAKRGSLFSYVHSCWQRLCRQNCKPKCAAKPRHVQENLV